MNLKAILLASSIAVSNVASAQTQPDVVNEPHVLIYVVTSFDYRAGTSTGHPDFTSRARCEAARDRLILGAQVNARNAKGPQNILTEPVAFCVPK